ncbi:MAG: hypothetical protein AAB579_04315, partial [Patescibacteria group bacterium]
QGDEPEQQGRRHAAEPPARLPGGPARRDPDHEDTGGRQGRHRAPQQHAAGDPLARDKDVASAVGEQLDKARAEMKTFVDGGGVDRASQKKVAQVVSEAEQMIETRAFDGALERVKAIQEIATVEAPLSLPEAITRVLKSVTSTIIGERK